MKPIVGRGPTQKDAEKMINEQKFEIYYFTSKKKKPRCILTNNQIVKLHKADCFAIQ